jgi:hypothetical protein
MALVLNYELTGMKLRSDAEVTNAVVQTYWKCHGHSADQPDFTGTFSGATPFDLNTIDPDTFTPYDQLTEAQVLEWIEAVVNDNPSYKEHIEEQITAQIAAQVAPETDVDEGQFPWETSSE